MTNFFRNNILSWWKEIGYEVRHFMKPPNVVRQFSGTRKKTDRKPTENRQKIINKSTEK
jgi:hypothetical protein